MTEATGIAPQRPRRGKLILQCSLIFLCGVITGVGLTVHFLHGRMRTVMEEPDQLTAMVTEFLTYRLELRPDQEEEVSQIIAERYGTIMELRQENVPKIRDEFDAIKNEVSVVLDESQKELWLRRFDRIHRGWAPPALLPPPGPMPSQGAGE